MRATTWLWSLVALALCAGAAQAAEIDAAMLRYPDVSATHITFVYNNDVWIAPKEGGTAVPLSSPDGFELLPHFSRDGQQVAFLANYDGTSDIYSMSIHGGIPKRLTYAPGFKQVVDWSPDGRVLYSAYNNGALGQSGLYLADPQGRIPTEIPVKMGDFASFDATGEWLAFSPYSYEFGTWGRYQGGSTADIWLYNTKTQESRRITDFPGTDDMPMFHENLVYFISDCGQECRRNIWVYDVATGVRSQVTNFTDYDVKWPGIGPSDIVFEQGGKLHLMSLPDNTVREVVISLPGDRPRLRPQSIDVSGQLSGASVSPGAKRVAANLRGDIWTLPAENGYPLNLTRSSGSAERDPSWSPDGKWIAYFSDATGEYELYTRPADGTGDPKQLTSNGTCFRFSPGWSPDSKKIAFTDKTGSYFIHLVDSGETITVDRNMWGPWGLSYDWAKDSNWFAYTNFDPRTSNGVIKLYDLSTRSAKQVTSAEFQSLYPSFDKSGDYLYFATDRNIEPLFGGLDDYETFLFTNTTVLAAMPLRKDVPSALAPKNDEDPRPAEEAAKPEGDKPAEGEKKEAPKVELLKFDLEGAEARTVILPLQASGYYNIEGADKKVFYLRGPRNGAGGEPAIFLYDLNEQKEHPVLAGVYGFDLTPDSSQLLAFAQGRLFITKALPGGAAQLDKPVNMGGLTVEIDPRAEWRQIVHDAWRIYRDYFYDPNMHGVDWPAVRERCLALVEHATSREDVNYILSYMISEVNASHTFVWSPGPVEGGKPGNIGMLGCDFELATDSEGREGFRIAKIYRGAEWELDVRSPLHQAGVDVREGDFLLAVNGVAIDTSRSPYAALQGMADRPTRLTVSSKAVIDGEARQALIKPLGSDVELRLRAWIESNRKYVEQQSGGKAGYIYVRSTGVDGLQDLQRQFIGQHSKEALVIDERWNAGGFIPHRFIELLSRPARVYYARRDSLPSRVPFRTHLGPKVMLINHAAGSGGDLFPYMFRQSGLGKLVGTRTWGGLTAIDGFPSFVDGGSISMPTMGAYEVDGTWGTEGHGVEPDYEVYNDPTSLAQGKDLQLDAAISVVMEELANNPWVDPAPPAWPDRTGPGSVDR